MKLPPPKKQHTHKELFKPTEKAMITKKIDFTANDDVWEEQSKEISEEDEKNYKFEEKQYFEE